MRTALPTPFDPGTTLWPALLALLALVAVPPARGQEAPRPAVSEAPADIVLPPEKRFPPVAIECWPDRYEIRATGEVVTTDGVYGRPLAQTSAIANAVRFHAEPGTTIGIHGVHTHGFALGSVFQSPHGTQNAYWRNGEGRHGQEGKGGYAPLDDVYFLGLDPKRAASISGVGGGSFQYGGFKRVGFRNLTFRFETPGGGKAPLSFTKCQVPGGRLYLYVCNVRAYKGTDAPWYERDHPFFQEDRPIAWGGYGKLWGMRMFEVTCDFRHLFIDSGKEHGMYMSGISPERGRPSYFVDILMRGNGRTGMQFTNRRSENRPVRGGYLVQDCVVEDGGTFDGGSDYTFVGAGGPIVLRNLVSRDPHHGSLVMWVDAYRPGGIWTYGGEQPFLEGGEWDATTHGYAYDTVLVDGFTVERSDGSPAKVNRAHATIIGARRVVVKGFDIHGTNIVWNGLAAAGTLAAGRRNGGPIPNGEVVWEIEGPLSRYAGWHASTKKIARQSATRDPDFLGDAEIDALKPD